MNFTEVYIVHNYDGCHKSKSFVGYLNCSSLCALGILMGDYYISSYNREELYSMSYVGYKYALELNSVECDDDYEFYMMNKRLIYSYIPVYENGSREFIELTKVSETCEEYNKDYINRLQVLLQNNDTIKLASNINSLISKYSSWKATKNNLDGFIHDLFTLNVNNETITKDITNELFKYCMSQSYFYTEDL